MLQKRQYTAVLILASAALIWLFLDLSRDGEIGSAIADAEPALGSRPDAQRADQTDHDASKDVPTDELDEVSPDSQLNDQVIGLFGLPIADPYNTYFENVDAAVGGDPDAQYQVASVLFECKGLPTQDYLDTLVNDGTLPPEMGDETQVRLDMCRQLIDSIPAQEFANWKSWLVKSARQGLTIAMGRELIFSPGSYTPEQARMIMKSLVRVDTPEKFAMISAYFANYKESDSIGYHAWMRISCQAIPNCEIDDYLGGGVELLRPNELSQVKDRVKKIESAIDTQAFDEIEF